MIVVDTNLLLYAVNRDFPEHERACDWLERTLIGNLPVRLPWIVILAFIRISTSQRVFQRPLQIEAASRYVGQWLALPRVDTLCPAEGHWQLLNRLLEQTGAGGNLTTDAHLATMAIQYGATLCSADNDFKRFPGLIHLNPLLDNAQPRG